MTTDIRDGVVWKPWWVRYAEFEGRKVVLIDRTLLPPERWVMVERELRAAAMQPGFHPDMLKRHYGVRWGPAPCLHIDECPFPETDHAIELCWTDSKREALAAFHDAEERLLAGKL